jgi:hypothetical protein
MEETTQYGISHIFEKYNFNPSMTHLDNFVGQDIVDIIKDVLVQFSLEYDINPCTTQREIECCVDEFINK